MARIQILPIPASNRAYPPYGERDEHPFIVIVDQVDIDTFGFSSISHELAHELEYRCGASLVILTEQVLDAEPFLELDDEDRRAIVKRFESLTHLPDLSYRMR